MENFFSKQNWKKKVRGAPQRSINQNWNPLEKFRLGHSTPHDKQHYVLTGEDTKWNARDVFPLYFWPFIMSFEWEIIQIIQSQCFFRLYYSCDPSTAESSFLQLIHLDLRWLWIKHMWKLSTSTTKTSELMTPIYMVRQKAGEGFNFVPKVNRKIGSLCWIFASPCLSSVPSRLHHNTSVML